MEINNNTSVEMMMNPMIRKISKLEEKSDDCATYSGIRRKCLFLLLAVIVGATIVFLLPYINCPGITDDSGIFVNYAVIVTVIAALIAATVCSILAMVLKKGTAALGTASCFSMGIVLGSVGCFLQSIRGTMLMALALTIAIVTAMLLIYFVSPKIKPSGKVRTVIAAFFVTAAIGAVFLVICYFLPGCSDIFEIIKEYPIISIGVALLGVLIAVAFLLIDFGTIRNAVENRLPKSYEWKAAFSLAFTIVWLYFKILNLFAAAQKASKPN